MPSLKSNASTLVLTNRQKVALARRHSVHAAQVAGGEARPRSGGVHDQTVRKRVDRLGDLWAPVLGAGIDLTSLRT